VLPTAAPYKGFSSFFYCFYYLSCPFLGWRLDAGATRTFDSLTCVSIPHFSRRATWPDHCLLQGVPVCLLDSRQGEGGVPGKAPRHLYRYISRSKFQTFRVMLMGWMLTIFQNVLDCFREFTPLWHKDLRLAK
jgi:hypothetical protein